MSSTKVKTGKVRFSYANVFEPKAMTEGGKEKYSVCLLIPKSDKDTLKKINDAIEAAYQEGKAKFGGKLPKSWKNPLRDGDLEREDNPEYEGMMFVNANSNRKPAVVEIVDKEIEPIASRDDFYSGCYGKATVNFYAFSVNGNKGVACGLGNILKLEDGERLSGGGASAEEDFGSEAEEDLM